MRSGGILHYIYGEWPEYVRMVEVLNGFHVLSEEGLVEGIVRGPGSGP